MQYFAYLITVVSIVGTFANSFKKRWCFILWSFTNTFWCIFNVMNASYAQALLYSFNLAMAIIEFIKWRQGESAWLIDKSSVDVKITCKNCSLSYVEGDPNNYQLPGYCPSCGKKMTKYLVRMGCTDDCVHYNDCILDACDGRNYLAYADACVSCGARPQTMNSMICKECERKVEQ